MNSTSTIEEELIASHGMDHSLDLLSDTYNYNHWLYSLIRPHMGDHVLEIGSGCGNITRFMLDVESLVCLEPLEYFVDVLNQIASVHSNIQIRKGIAENMAALHERAFDTMVCLNVLEHIEDDQKALEEMYAALAPGGKLLLFIPACQWAFGDMDTELKHFRRYSKGGLKDQLLDANFNVLQCKYVNFVGVFGWWWAGRIQGEKVIDPAKARLVDKLVPYLSAVERLIPPPCGQSVLAIAQKPNTAS